MKSSKVLCALILPVLLLTGCGEKDDGMTIHYSDDEIHIQYNGEDIEYDLSGNNSDTAETPEYDPAMVIDLFADVEDWLVYSGTDDNGSVEIYIPDDYEQEYNGYYFVKDTAYSMVHNFIKVICSNEYIGRITYNLENNYGLSVNDVFTVSCSMTTPQDRYDADIPSAFAPTGHIILETARSYTFTGTGESYITSADQLTQEHFDIVGDYIYEYATEEYLGQAGMFSEDEFYYYNIEKVYFASLKPTGILTYKGRSMLTLIITNDGKTYTVDIYGLTLDKDNNFSFVNNTTYRNEIFDQNFNYVELDVDM